jgi:hypothetical protein
MVMRSVNSRRGGAAQVTRDGYLADQTQYPASKV